MHIELTDDRLARLTRTVVAAYPESKIEQIKQLRLLTGLRLVWSKDLVEACEPRDPVLDVAQRAIIAYDNNLD